MAEFYLGQIIQGGWNFAPHGTLQCSGQILSIAQNAALFSLLGTQYGGNGTQTFAIPDLRGRKMIGWGSSTTGTTYVIGQTGGSENVSILTSNLPAHNHTATFANNGSTLSAATTRASLQQAVVGAVFGRTNDGATNPTSIPELYCPAGTATPNALGGLNVAGTVTLGMTGSGLPISVLGPLNVVTHAIATTGLFPSRN